MTSKPSRFKVGTALLFSAHGFCVHNAHAWQSDNGDGTFKNPVLYADYPDPDIIRETNDIYMVSTTFVDSPGINVLHSKVMVNWEIVSHCATNLDGGDAYNLIGGTAYQGGYWASIIRFRNGTFYVAVQPTFSHGRIYYATNAAGPWQYHQLSQNIYDPGLFFDTDGTGYIVCGHDPQSVMTLNSNYSQVVAVSNNVVNSGGPYTTIAAGVTATNYTDTVPVGVNYFYNVKRSATNGGPYSIVANVTTTNYTDTGLTNGTIYYYAVSALNPAGESANSVQLAIPPRPSVSLTLTETNLKLSWPLASEGFTLQSRTNLVLGEWENLTSPAPQISGDQWQAMLPLPGDAGSVFYRLAK